MGVFEDFVVKAKKAVDVAGKKTGEMVDVTKLRLTISEQEAKIEKELSELGKQVYNAGKDQSDYSEAVREKIQSLDALYEGLANLKNEYYIKKQMKKCPACGNINGKDSAYCSKCGASI